MKGLTDRQLQVVNFIKDFTEKYSYPPTVQEIADHFEITIRSVQNHLIALQKKGAISSSEKRCRSIRVLLDTPANADDRDNSARIPVLGKLHEGKPLLSEDNIENYICLSFPLINPVKNYFAFNIQNDDFMKNGIMKGDTAVVEQTLIVSEGQLAAVVESQTLKLKSYSTKKDNIRIEGILSNIIRCF